MHFLTDELFQQLLANGRQQAAVGGAGGGLDFHPVVKLFTPDAGAIWLLTEINPEQPDIAFGLCDLGLGFPELGTVSLKELAALRVRSGLLVERDRHFVATKPLSAYAEEARQCGGIRA